MQRIFRYKHDGTNSVRLRTSRKWYLSRDSQVCNPKIYLSVKALENDKYYEELV